MELSGKHLRRMSDNAQKPKPDERIPIMNPLKDWQLDEVERVIQEEEMLRESAEIDRHTYYARGNL